MKKQLLKKMSAWLVAFLILALAFLAVGLGTLGSVQSTGDSYVLNARRAGDGKEPAIVFSLSDPLADNENYVRRDLYIKEVYLNLGTIYGNFGQVATVRLGRGTSSASSYYNYEELSYINVFTTETEEGGAASSAVRDGLFNWVAFNVPEEGWRLSTYPYFRLMSRAQNFLVNEIVFVAYEENGTEPIVLNAKVDATSVLPYDAEKGETAEDALKRAEAVIDSQHIPSLAQSSYNRFTGEELHTLMSVAEMKQGGSFSGDNVYHGDNVYGSLGVDLVALGTAIFGMSPFGLRFMPFLASFGVLVFGYLLVKALTGSEKAGFVFAVLYVLSGISFSLGHLGTPLMIGLFFLLGSLYFCIRYYREGFRKADFVSALPSILSALFAAAAVCVHGALIIPVAAIVALFLAGVVRHRREADALLDEAIGEAEAEESEVSVQQENAEPSEGRKKVAHLLGENKFKSTVAPALFFAFLVLGAFLIAMLSSLPLYFTYVKIYDDPSAPTKSVFQFLWQAFAGGFVGFNEIGKDVSAWNFFYELFRGTGAVYGVTGTGTAVALAAIVAGLAGVGYFIAALIRRVKDDNFHAVFESVLPLFAGVLVSLITASFAPGGLLFLSLAYVFLFALAAAAVGDAGKEGGKTASLVNKISVVFLVLLVVCFALFAVFTFSVPTAGFLAGLYA